MPFSNDPATWRPELADVIGLTDDKVRLQAQDRLTGVASLVFDCARFAALAMTGTPRADLLPMVPSPVLLLHHIIDTTLGAAHLIEASAIEACSPMLRSTLEANLSMR